MSHTLSHTLSATHHNIPHHNHYIIPHHNHHNHHNRHNRHDVPHHNHSSNYLSEKRLTSQNPVPPPTLGKSLPLTQNGASMFPLDIGSSSNGTKFHLNQPHVNVGGNFGDPPVSTFSGGLGGTNGHHSLDINGGSSFYGDQNIPGSNWIGTTYTYTF